MVTRSDSFVWSDAPGPGDNAKGMVHGKALGTRENMYDHARVFSHIVLKPGCAIGDHVHEGETEFYYILKGEGTFNDNGNIVTVLPGDLCETGHGAMHAMENAGSEPLEFIALIVLDN